MKKVFFTIAVVAGAMAASAQSEKFVAAMTPKVAAIDTIRTASGFVDLASAFERIGDAEKTQWLPYYYAALAHINATYMGGMQNLKADKVDPTADRAEALLNKAEALKPNNSEIYIVKKMIASLRMMADPMNRWQTYGPQAQEALDKAKALNPENPRVLLLAGQDKFFTPEQFGGSKEEAKKLFEEAIKKYDAFKPASPLEPTWGKPTTQYFLGQIK